MEDKEGKYFANEKDYLIKKGIIKLLLIKDSDIRIMTLEQCRDAIDKSIHAGGAFSAIIPLVSLYYGGIINIDIENPTKIGQDVFVLSKGHAIAALASIYADLGYFSKNVLKNSRSVDSILNGHPGPLLPGIHVSTGPLGQGLSVATGFAMAGKKTPNFDVYCMVGDGEIQEGTIWEAVMYAGYKKLDNMCLIIDANGGQLDDVSSLIIDEGDVKKAFESFGWRVYEVDGTQYLPMYEALRLFKYGIRNGSPTVIISRTEKGFGGFSNIIAKHKVTISDEVIKQEIQMQEEERKRRIGELEIFLKEILVLDYGSEIFKLLCKYAEKMNLQLEIMNNNGLNKIIRVNKIEPYVKTKSAPVRDKKLRYKEEKLPVLEKGKLYNMTEIVSKVMSVLATDPRVVSVDADLASVSGLLGGIQNIDVTRAFNVGIAEANMMGIGEAFAVLGYNVWVSTFCPFFEWRVMRRIAIGYQERVEVIENGNGWLTEGHGLDITFVATASNLDTQTNGATHMGNDDIMMVDCIGHIKIIDVCCPQQLIAVMKWIAEGNKGLIYLRIMRGLAPVIYDHDYTFEYNKGYVIKSFSDVEGIIISSGRGVHEACLASDILLNQGLKVGVIDMPSIDERLLLNLYEKNIPLIIAEQNNGYIWNNFMKVLFKEKKVISTKNLISINTLDKRWRPQFIHSGTYDEITKKYSLDGKSLAQLISEKLRG